MKTRSLVLAAALSSAGLMSPAFAANLFADFSITQNPNGAWAYGWASVPGGAFTAFNQVANPMDGAHTGLQGWKSSTLPVPLLGVNITGATIADGNVDLPVGEILLHSAGNSAVAGEVRWTAPSSGAYQVVASFTGRQINMKGNMAVFNNAASVFAQSIAGNGTSTAYNGILNLLAGDVLSFSVQRLALDANGFGGNWTGVAVDINSVAAVPEPASLALMVLGLGAVVGVSRRRREC